MPSFKDLIKNRSKVIDEATEETKSPVSSGPTTTITIQHPEGSSVSATPDATPDRKYDDYLQKWVPTKNWKSPQQHEADKEGFQSAR